MDAVQAIPLANASICSGCKTAMYSHRAKVRCTVIPNGRIGQDRGVGIIMVGRTLGDGQRMGGEMTMKEMCEKIVESDILRKPNGEAPTAREIFEYSPSGELFMVFEWYDMAVEVIKAKAAT